MSSLQPPAGSDRTVRSIDDLVAVFHGCEKPSEQWRIGTEAEKFGVTATGKPVGYAGEDGVLRILQRLEERFGWSGLSEVEGGPTIALRRDGASITLEPAAQLELSGAPLSTIHETAAEMADHLRELEEVSADLGHLWLATGFHPFATHDQLPWVPKQRYSVMKTYLPTRGARALDMMRRTTTVQANFDYSSEQDAMRKLRVMLRLGIVLGAMFANAPFLEGRRSRRLSERADVWLHMDPARSGRIRPLWDAGTVGYRDYVEWALDAGMFLFKRGERVYFNTGQSFRSFFEDGFEGERPTIADWWTHLNSLFPDVRLKNTIEVRPCDGVPRHLVAAMPAVVTGLLYDDVALARAEALASTLTFDDVQRASGAAAVRALGADLAGRPLRAWAEDVVEIARAGLARRDRQSTDGDETRYVEPLVSLVSAGRVPAHVAAEGIEVGQEVSPLELARRCAV